MTFLFHVGTEPYSPPECGEVDFTYTGGYSAPTCGDVDFDFDN